MHNYCSKLVDSSRMLADILTADVSNDPNKFDEMMELALRDEYPLSMRAARVVALASQKHILLPKPYLQKMVDILPVAKVDGVVRSFLWILTNLPLALTEDMLGKLTDLAFDWVGDTNKPIAIRAQSIDILIKVSRVYPEITPELIALLENMTNKSSPGLKGKCLKTIKMLRLKSK